MLDTVVLDYIDGISLDQKNAPISNLHAVHYLPDGIKLLAGQIRQEEIEVFKHNQGKPPLFRTVPETRSGYLSCFFIWFSITLVSYLRFVKFVDVVVKQNWETKDLTIGKNREFLKQECTTYIKGLVPAVYTFRNKIGAHLAITDPFEADNVATLELSAMIPIAYRRPYIVVGAMQWETAGVSSNLPEWALTEIFESLASRFWPTTSLPPIQL